jgi:hypothetical protein
MRVLFIDHVSPRPYDPELLEATAFGGTEQTVARVAEGLAMTCGIEVCVEQRTREKPSRFGARYETVADAGFDPTHVVVLRDAAQLAAIRVRFPRSKLLLWHHDLQLDREPYLGGCRALVQTGASAVCVSRFHRRQLVALLEKVYPGARNLGSLVHVVYNPIDDDLQPDDTPVCPDKLVFMSSPHKGLLQTLDVFARFQSRDELRDMTLYVANPGYLPTLDTSRWANVVNLGPLVQRDLMRHVRESVCAFHYNLVYPETFGLAHAECHAVGTPFLSSALGANVELMEHPDECMDLRDVPGVLDRVALWKRGNRPHVRGRAALRTSAVVAQWLDLLAEQGELQCAI